MSLEPEAAARAPDTAHWAEVEALFDVLVDVPEAQRRQRLDELCGRHTERAVAEVRQMLDSLARDSTLLESAPPVWNSPMRNYVPGEQLGSWQVDGVLGRGGQGLLLRVHRVEGGFRQDGVLKTLLNSEADPDSTKRLLRERQLLSDLNHPNLPALLDGGQLEDGAPYLVIEYVDGLELSQHLRRHSPSQPQRVAMLRQLAAVLKHAHSRLVLHRDLKPANVLIEANGRAVLLDFGVAQLIDTGQTHTRAGYTPGYAAPEQILGERCSVATDVYGLGALACAMLLGRSPFSGDDAASQMRAVLDDTPVLPDSLDRDLAAIIAKALRKDAPARYSSIEAMDNDLERWQQGLPVLAHSGGRRYVIGKFMRRHRIGLSLSALALLLVAGTTAVAIDQALRSERARLVAEEAVQQSAWDLEQSQQNLAYQNAYALVLENLFRNDSGVDQGSLVRALLKSANEAMTASSANPDEAALMLFAIGRHFMFRKDHINAMKVLEPWVEAGFGQAQVLREGRGILARTYMDVDREEQAIEILRLLLAEKADSRDRHTPTHAATASQLALSSKLPEDLEHAAEVINATLRSADHGVELESYLHNQLALVQIELGDFDAALVSMEHSVVDRIDSLVGDPTGRFSGELNLASLYLFHARDSERARLLIESRRSVESLLEGLQPVDGLALYYLGLVAREQSRHADSVQLLRAAHDVQVQHFGAENSNAIAFLTTLAEALALNAELDEANRLIAQLTQGKPSDGAATNLRLIVAQALVLHNGGASEEAQALLAAHPQLTERARTSPLLSYLLTKLGDYGVSVSL